MPFQSADAAGTEAAPPPAPAVPKKIGPPSPNTAGAWILVLVGVIVAGGLLAQGALQLSIILVAMLVLVLVLGNAIVHRYLGALINSQNVMSLSRLQMIVWTIVILSSYLAYAFARIQAKSKTPLDITLDSTLLSLMGISSASFVGAPMLLGMKRDKEPNKNATEKTARMADEAKSDVDQNRQGTLYANTNLSDARITDIFQGDEIGNTMQLDLAKLQMFLFTVITVVAYLALVFSNLRSDTPNLDSLPVLSSGFVTALGISHAGYLSSKGIDHTPLA